MFDGRGGLNTLPQKLRQFLLDQPETTQDLHVVSVILKDGRVFEDVAISHCSLVAAVRGHAHVPFDAKDITELRVTHRRWGFGQQPKPSESSRKRICCRSNTHGTRKCFSLF